MNTKSTIQLLGELIVAKNKFFEHLEELCAKYRIQNSIFCCDAQGLVQECSSGYFGACAEFDSIEEAKQNFNILCQGIQVKENKFIVGNLYKNLKDIKEEHIIDIKNSIVIL